MSKAEERAKKKYWLEPSNIDTQNKYQAYLEGYHQAEKDLHKSFYKAGLLDGFEDAVEGQYEKGYEQAEKDMELTWEDIADILDVTDVIANDDSMEGRLKTMSEEEYCQEVLKRFKEKKENG